MNKKKLKKLLKISMVLWGVLIAVILIVLLARSGGKENNKKKKKGTGNEITSTYQTVSKEKINEFKERYKDKDFSDYVVCIDPGHGGDDVGGETIGGTYEKLQTLELSHMVRQYLESVGVKVVMTRTADETLTLGQRRKIAEDNKANLLLSIHRNIYEGTEDISGVEAWINSIKPGDAVNVSEKIIEDMIRNVPVVESRGVKSGSMDNPNENYEVNKVTMTSLILEVGFMSSVYDNKWFDSSLEDVAKGIAEGVIDGRP